MIDRRKIIENLFQNIHAMRHKLMIGYTNRNILTITPSQSFVLRFVAQNPTANVKAIAQALHITSSAATQLIDGLVEKGYLKRKENPDDRRIMTLSLSEKAKKLFKKFKEQGLEKMTVLFNSLSDEELKQYAALNQKIIDNIITKQE